MKKMVPVTDLGRRDQTINSPWQQKRVRLPFTKP